MRSREKIKKFLETNENEHTTAQTLRYTVKAVLRGNFIAIQAYLKKIETFQINNLTLHLQELEEQPWLVWLSGLSAGMQTKGLLV